ncbi:MAG: VOC family protein [Streptomyces sp.]|uniref:VOC family protein n=1 Tax=Streptomyces sp. TaxID=1931 RepID=UPI003D6BDDD0
MTEPLTRNPHQGHTPGQHAPGTPCWASLLVHDLAEGQEFYHQLFGWEFSSGPRQLGRYVRATLDGREVAGLGEITPGRRLRVAWLPYMASDDVDATADLIRERGGTVAVGPLDAEDAGRMAIAADPAGANFGVWHAARHRGLRPAEAGAPGTPVWHELVTREATSAGHFYPGVFGYEPGPTPQSPAGLDRLTLHLDGTPVAGIQGAGEALPHESGPYWKTYFAVGDTDAAVRRVHELGGRVLSEPEDSPHGRVATFADPEGAQFSVIAPAPAPA